MDRTREILDRLVAWSPVLLLGALAALTYWLDAQVQPPAARRDGSTRHDPDLFLQDFKAITFDAQGQPARNAVRRARRAFPDDDSAELARPRLSLTEPGRPTLTITADRGRIDGDREQRRFHGQRARRARRRSDATAGRRRPPGPVTLTHRARCTSRRRNSACKPTSR